MNSLSDKPCPRLKAIQQTQTDCAGKPSKAIWEYYFHQDLQVEAHITNLLRKQVASLALAENLKRCPEELKELAYFAWVYFGLKYMRNTRWDPALKQEIDKATKIKCRQIC